MKHLVYLIFLRLIFLYIIIFYINNNLYSQTKIDTIRNAIKKISANWTPGKTSMSDVDFMVGTSEVVSRFIFAKEGKAKTVHLPKVENLPEKFDWRNYKDKDWTTPVKNQNDPVKNAPYCTSFSILGQVESWWKIKNDKPDSVINLSEQWLLSNSFGYFSNINVLMGILTDSGVPRENCFPYKADHYISSDDACQNWWNEVVKIAGWGYITFGYADIDIIKTAILKHPITSGFDYYEDFGHYTTGVYQHSWGKHDKGHGVVIIGWDDTDSCWIGKNSWGTEWGETVDFKPYTPGNKDGGYFRIKYGECGIGKIIPFIWEEMCGGNDFVVTPKKSMYENVDSSFSSEIQLINNSSSSLEFSTRLGQTNVESKFHLSEHDAWNGLSWWCGDEKLIGYGDYWLQYLDLPVINISNKTNPKLKFAGRWSTQEPGVYIPKTLYDGFDGCNVWISIDSGKSFNVIHPTSPTYNCNNLLCFADGGDGWGIDNNIPGWAGNSKNWIPIEFDLTPYESDNIIIRFAFASDGAGNSSSLPNIKGFFIDDIQVFDDDGVIYENFGEPIDQSYTNSYTGRDEADWLKVNDGFGTIPPNDSVNILIDINTESLGDGKYSGIVVFAYNDSTMMPYLPTGRLAQIDLEITGNSTAVELQDKSIPASYQLCQNYPNPFNPGTTIKYSIPIEVKSQRLKFKTVTLKIFDLLGREVTTLVNQKQKPGNYEVSWDATNYLSGVYFYKLTAGDFTNTKKMILLR